MPLIIDESNTFDIPVFHNGDMDNFLIYDKESDGKEKDVFTFRRPNWVDIRIMNSASVIVDAVSGKAIIDPYKYMDMKVKSLLTAWTIKKGQEILPVSPDNVNVLHPNLIPYLFQKIEEKLTPTEATPITATPPTEG